MTSLKMKFYNEYRKENKITDSDKELESLGFSEEEITEIRENQEKWIEQIEECSDFKDKKWKYGVELEYEGENNRLIKRDDDIIEDVKDDCSVNGDGTEYNLLPLNFSEAEENKNALESFMFRAANHNCLVGFSAGNHIHYSYENIREDIKNRSIGVIFNLIFPTDVYYNEDEEAYLPDDFDYYGEDYDDVEEAKENCYGGCVEEILRFRISDEEYRYAMNDYKDRTLVLYKAAKWLYSTSNRDGNEPYGVGADGTRGFTHHGTVELRVWRTTLDYRNVIARAYIGKFFIEWVQEKESLYDKGFIDYSNEDIWKDFLKDPFLKNMYIYACFNAEARHRTGYTREELIEKLGISTIYAEEIERRSSLITESLNKDSIESQVKELFRF